MAFPFPDVEKIRYEGPESKNPLAFRWYNEDEMVEGKTPGGHLRFRVIIRGAFGTSAFARLYVVGFLAGIAAGISVVVPDAWAFATVFGALTSGYIAVATSHRRSPRIASEGEPGDG